MVCYNKHGYYILWNLSLVLIILRHNVSSLERVAGPNPAEAMGF
jgi:hypothetical protein